MAVAPREEARRSGRPLKRIVSETLRAGLAARKAPATHRYRLTPVSLGGVVPGIDLDKALRLAEALELGASICSTDADFGRFPGVAHISPL